MTKKLDTMYENGEITAPIISISEVAPSSETLYEIPPEKSDHLHIDRTFQRRESILASEITLFVEKTKIPIPDGGWGWLVVVACFFINVVSDGVAFCFGLLYIEFLHEFEASKSATSWVGSLFMALPLMAGPIGSALVDKYGCRSMTVIGGVVCTIGLILSAYTRSIVQLYITFGVIGGLGLCLSLVTAVVSIAFWFEKKRTLAMGIAASGSGFGTAVFSPIANWCLSEYGWRGTMLFVAGIFFNLCVCGCLMRDPDWLIQEEKQEKKFKLRRKSSCSSLASDKIEELKNALTEGGDTQYLLETIDATLDLSKKERFSSVINLPTFIKQNEKVPLEALQLLSENKELYSVVLENYPNLLNAKSTSEKDLNKLSNTTTARIPMKFSMTIQKADEQPQPPLTPITPIAEEPYTGALISNSKKKVPLFRSISYKAKNQLQPQPHTYLKNLRFRRNSISHRGAMLNLHKYRMKASSCPDLFKNSMATICSDDDETWYGEFLNIIKGLTNFSLFLDLHFLLLSLSTIILFIWFVVPYFYLAELMTKTGYSSSQAAFAISLIGITNTLGMVILGWIGDRLNIAKSYAICLILCGASVGAIIMFVKYYIVLLVSSGCFGIFFASCLSLTPSLLAELVPLDDFTMAYGLILLCQGIGNLTGPPLAGWLFDITQSWNQSFYQAAFWIIISGLLIGIIPYTENRKLFSKKKPSIRNY